MRDHDDVGVRGIRGDEWGLASWLVVLVVLLVACRTSAPSGEMAGDPTPQSSFLEDPESTLSREEAVADIGQLMDFLERTHPDPYGRQGKVAVHLRLHRLLQRIPEDGVSVSDLHSLVQPFLVSLEDGHTQVQPLRSVQSEGGEGLPLDLRVLAASASEPEPAVYIQGYADETLLGSRIERIEGITVSELIRRSRLWDGHENEFGNLQNLLRRLDSEKGLRELLPEWTAADSVRLSVVSPAGDRRAVHVRRGAAPATWDGESVETAVDLPAAPAGVPAYSFMDGDRKTALLRLDNTWAYRETFESLTKHGQGNLRWAQVFYRRYYGEEPPADTAALVASAPSATQILSDLVEEMRAAETERLIVDLRRNSGGTSMLADMLLYFLYGRQGWQEFYGNFHTIRRLTPDDLQGVDSTLTSRFPYRVGDYDFSELRETGSSNEDYWKRTTITFAEELKTGEHEGYYLPPEVIAAVSPATFSGGFWIAAGLHRMGARLAGVPSGQAGNAYGQVKYTVLANSGIRVGVSSRRFVLFPEDRAGMTVLPVDLPLTEARWRDLRYDPNASILMALQFGSS